MQESDSLQKQLGILKEPPCAAARVIVLLLNFVIEKWLTTETRHTTLLYIRCYTTQTAARTLSRYTANPNGKRRKRKQKRGEKFHKSLFINEGKRSTGLFSQMWKTASVFHRCSKCIRSCCPTITHSSYIATWQTEAATLSIIDAFVTLVFQVT